jgi:hypothetical protein
MTDHELMQQALHALEATGIQWPQQAAAISALRERLAQKDAEPVTDSRCHYLMNRGSVCNKCGRIHDAAPTMLAAAKETP